MAHFLETLHYFMELFQEGVVQVFESFSENVV